MNTRLMVIHVCFAAAFLSACGGGDGDTAPTPTPAPGPAPTPAPGPSPAPSTGPSVWAPFITPGTAGTIALLAGSHDNGCGSADGVGAQAGLGEAGALTVHQGKVWLAELGCDLPDARVRTIDAETGDTTTYASQPFSSQGAVALGFSYPTGIALDSTGQVFVMGGAAYTPLATPPLRPGFSGGVWQVTPGAMTIFAGVLLDRREDGLGQAAGFTRPHGLTIDAQDVMYTNDAGVVRAISGVGRVSTLPGSHASHTPPVMVEGGVHALSAHPGNALIDVATGQRHADLGQPWELVQVDGKGNVYAADTPDGATTVYRRKAGEAEFVPVVGNVQQLTAMALDEQGRLYLKQRHAVSKVVLD